MNKALRVKDDQLLYQFRFFIIDLCDQINIKWKSARLEGLIDTSLIVYRGGKLTRTEVIALQSSDLIMTNGFLSTTFDEEVAQIFIRKPESDQSTYCAVLFHITVPENLTSVIFAILNKENTLFSDEKEVRKDLKCRIKST